MPTTAYHPTAEALAEMRETVSRRVAAGFDDAEDIIESEIEYFADEAGVDEDVLEPVVTQLVGEAMAAHRAEQATWPEITDCDRLDQAFALLESWGIVARQDFTCCQNCGFAEIWDEVQEAQDSGRTVWGIVFYHQQDTESAVSGRGLCLAYGANTKEHNEAATLQVARRIVDALQSVGFTVEWDGTTRRRICVPQLDWKRRR